MEIFVMRHGRTDFNERGLINGFLDDPLNEIGRQEVRTAVLQLPETVRRIYASPLARTRETAEIVSESAKLPITFHEELKEVNFGERNGTPFYPDIRKLHETMQYDWRPSGECVEDVKARVTRVLATIMQENQPGEALIVAHGGIIRLLAYLESQAILGRVENAALYRFDGSRIMQNV
jgi:broad specificity phosphatase PhoE